MRNNFVVAPKAKREMHEILHYIARDNFPASERMRKKFYDAFQKLGDHPSMGQVRDDLTAKKVRFWPVHPNYMIVYDPLTTPVRILRIIHSARHLADLL